MAKIVECVPNFSEGQKKEVVDAISEAISSTEGCSLLDVDPGASTNRTVYTFVGTPDAVVNGAINAAKVAFKLIDMSKHKGEHPRMGAMDVCPFIPIQGVTMEDCVTCANKCGERLAAELGVPSYLYGFASNRPYRKFIPQIRAGEYEDLPLKLNKPEWEPDFGPTKFVPSWGATLVGARNFLIAYNVNLLSTKEQAHRIALDIREQGRGPEKPGKLKCVQAIGWYLDEANLAQVSVNITDTEVTGLHQVFEEVVAVAKELKLGVVGSQVVGLVPLKAILQAAEFYIEKENLFVLEEDQKIRLAIERLGLSSVGAFNPKERIIEFIVQKDIKSPLLSLSVRDFVKSVSERTPAPGGGSVAALTASLGAALNTMAGLLTFGNKKFAGLDGHMRKLLPSLYEKTKSLVLVVEEDSKAFNDYMAAMKLPKDTDAEIEHRNKEMVKALYNAIDVPLNLIKSINELWAVIKELSHVANIACISDLQVGVRSLEAAVWGGHYNVLANIKQLKSKEEASNFVACSTKEVKFAVESAREILSTLDESCANMMEEGDVNKIAKELQEAALTDVTQASVREASPSLLTSDVKDSGLPKGPETVSPLPPVPIETLVSSIPSVSIDSTSVATPGKLPMAPLQPASTLTGTPSPSPHHSNLESASSPSPGYNMSTARDVKPFPSMAHQSQPSNPYRAISGLGTHVPAPSSLPTNFFVPPPLQEVPHQPFFQSQAGPPAYTSPQYGSKPPTFPHEGHSHQCSGQGHSHGYGGESFLEIPQDHGMPSWNANHYHHHGAQGSDGLFGWFSNVGTKVFEKTKSSVESMITTLDPGMKAVLYSGGDVDIVVTTSNVDVVEGIRQAFQEVFGRATVNGTEARSDIAPQPVGFTAGLRGAENKIENLRRWFEFSCLVLKDPVQNVDLTTFTQAVPINPTFIQQAQELTRSDYELRWSGLSVTIGEAVARNLPYIHPLAWHKELAGTSKRDMVYGAAKVLATLYKNQCH